MNPKQDLMADLWNPFFKLCQSKENLLRGYNTCSCKIIQENLVLATGHTAWGGCIDHLLELATTNKYIRMYLSLKEHCKPPNLVTYN
jgi:hypothetical protein